jgi:hypothetical protein
MKTTRTDHAVELTHTDSDGDTLKARISADGIMFEVDRPSSTSLRGPRMVFLTEHEAFTLAAAILRGVVLK